jgi:hypothetical protein
VNQGVGIKGEGFNIDLDAIVLIKARPKQQTKDPVASLERELLKPE